MAVVTTERSRIDSGTHGAKLTSRRRAALKAAADMADQTNARGGRDGSCSRYKYGKHVFCPLVKSAWARSLFMRTISMHYNSETHWVFSIDLILPIGKIFGLI